MKPSKEVAARLAEARENAGLSQGQVARKLDLHRPTISEIEAGRRRVSVEELALFAKTYKVSIAWLSGEDSSDQLPEHIQLAARELDRLGKEDLDKVLRIIASAGRGGDKKET